MMKAYRVKDKKSPVGYMGSCYLGNLVLDIFALARERNPGKLAPRKSG